MTSPPLDCVIVGAGPAGLTAAIYLARFHLSVTLVDAGHSRALSIPRTRNHAGYPKGISGADLVSRMRQHAEQFGATLTHAAVLRVQAEQDLFLVHCPSFVLSARTVLLATGVVNNRPPMAPEQHDAAVAAGLLRYCPVCDGYEVTDQQVGVIGTGAHGVDEASFLRMYSRAITLISPEGGHALSPEQRLKLEQLGIRAVDGPCGELRTDGPRIVAPTSAGDLAFDTIYPALGSVIRSELATDLGAAATADGSIEVDAHQRTTVRGLYAAGDVTKGLDQISHAMGEAGVAATTIRNDLAQDRPLVR
ncbi:MAG: NAD(P)/FAD-dependent oxidoreductase [Pseudomonadota bacterium]